jgi:hypothetical protein
VTVGLLLLLVTLPNLGPVVRAGRADGTRGTFTAEELRCIEHPGHEQSSWQGRAPRGLPTEGQPDREAVEQGGG